MTAVNAVHLLAILLVGLLAGLLYSYDCSIIRGLGNLSDKEYLGAFQSINKVIVNPYFLVSFVGSLLLLPVAAGLMYSKVFPAPFYFLLAAAMIYIAGVVGVTAFGNIPLNNILADFDINAASSAGLAGMRQNFEAKWNVLHHICTYAAILSFLLAAASAVIRSN